MSSLRHLLLASLIACSLVFASACTKSSPANNNSNQTNSSPVANTPNPVPMPAVRGEATVKPPKPGKGNIQVMSMPSGAGVTLLPTDESGASAPQTYGRTPVTIADLAPGTYTVQVALSGYKTFVKDMKVTPNSTLKVNAALKK
jgi:hypothetical protein